MEHFAAKVGIINMGGSSPMVRYEVRGMAKAGNDATLEEVFVRLVMES